MKPFAILAIAALCGAATAAPAAPLGGTFDNIDGGTLSLSDWAGQPVLVVNTASFCGFTGQYEGLQALWEAHREAGLVVLAVPSDDFNQEFGTSEEVAEFCEMTYGIDLPMTEITRVTGPEAHPFYAALRAQTGWQPQWNFNKVLIDGAGEVVGTYGSGTRPEQLEPQIVALLGGQ